jgi:hypothetical protein
MNITLNIDSVKAPADGRQLGQACDRLHETRGRSTPAYSGAGCGKAQMIAEGAEYRAFRELRVHHGKTRYWIIFRRSGRLFVLLHMLTP